MNFLKNAKWQHWLLVLGAVATTLGTVAMTGTFDAKNPATWVGAIVQVVMAVAALNKNPPAGSQ